MGTLHFALNIAASYAIIVAIQLLDRRYLLRPEVRERAWNRASWGSAVYGLGFASFLGWGWVTRSRFDCILARLFRRRPDGDLSSAGAIVRGSAGLLTGVLEAALGLVAISAFELLLTNVFGLPSFGGIGG
jgi:hypothetical protein